VNTDIVGDIVERLYQLSDCHEPGVANTLIGSLCNTYLYLLQHTCEGVLKPHQQPTKPPAQCMHASGQLLSLLPYSLLSVFVESQKCHPSTHFH
jgi:hypothetical protein